MINELKIKKCPKCGAIVKVIKTCKCSGCGITCCQEEMLDVKANSIDAAREKHIPTYIVRKDYIEVSVNHVMEEEHYIEWICLKSDNREEYVYFKPGEVAKAIFKNHHNGILYSYCNKHGLWSVEIK